MLREIKKGNLKSNRMKKLLMKSLITNLKYKNFNQITINDICEKALISRATFYVHFIDKFDLFEFWLLELSQDIIKEADEYEKIATAVNEYIIENQIIISNIITDAKKETLELIRKFTLFIVTSLTKETGKNTNEEDIILSNFCTGGILALLLSQVKNDYPPNSDIVTPFSYKMIKYCILWDQKYSDDL